MKKILLFLFCISAATQIEAQIINDNKVSFSYIQLPLIEIDAAFKNYEVRVTHSYNQANADSLALYELRKNTALAAYEQARILYQAQRDSLELQYLLSLSTWEKQVNAGALTATGQPIPKPQPPIFPQPPMYPNVKPVKQHSPYDENVVKQIMKIEGFEQGLGGSILSIDIQPLRDINIVQSKKGSGSATKYQYNCEYILPVEVKLETPTQGVLLKEVLLQSKKSYPMQEHKSQYDHQIYMLNNEDLFYAELEQYARRNAIIDANNYVNDQVGYVDKKRTTEIYSVKKFKNYDYQDVTNAYSKTVQALSLIGNDRDRSGAQESLEEAMKMWNEIMIESNTYDSKVRINDKISAMIQCNIAEIQVWQSKFNEANSLTNLISNSKVLKARSHVKRMTSYYENLQKRWEINY